MVMTVAFEKLVEMISDRRVSDESVGAALPEVTISLNADANSSGRLALACLIGHYRPRLLSRALANAVDPMIAMGVETAEQLWSYARSCVERHSRLGYLWNDTAIAYLRDTLIQHELVVQHALGVGLIEAAEHLGSAGPECRRAGLRCLVVALANAEARSRSAEQLALTESLRRITGQGFTTSGEWSSWFGESSR